MSFAQFPELSARHEMYAEAQRHTSQRENDQSARRNRKRGQSVKNGSDGCDSSGGNESGRECIDPRGCQFRLLIVDEMHPQHTQRPECSRRSRTLCSLGYRELVWNKTRTLSISLFAYLGST